MKKKKILPILLAVLILFSTGCTKYLSDSNNKRVTNKATGQAVTSNILCLPEDEDNIKLYEKYQKNLDVNYKKLNSCEDFSPTDLKYQGLWESIFVKPLAWLIIKIGILVKNYGLSVMIIGIIIRLVLMPFTKKALLQSEQMKKAQPEIEKLQRKYGKTPSQEDSARMSQEMMMIYKKYNISPLSGCLTSFIQLPILFAFLEAINRVPVIFEGSFLTLQLGTTPLVGIRGGNYLYLVLILLIIGTTYLSFKNSGSMSMGGNSDQEKQTAMMMKFMIVFISIASLSLPTALALYWIVSNAFMIVQNMVLKKKKSESDKIFIKQKGTKKKNDKVSRVKKEQEQKVKNAKVVETKPKRNNKK